jgi:hypothetical protein
VRSKQFLAIWRWRQRLLGHAFRRLLTVLVPRVRFCVFGKLREGFSVAFPIANVAPLGPVRLAKWPDNAQAGDMALETLGCISNINFTRLIRIRPQDDIEAAQKLRVSRKPFTPCGAAIP